MIKQQIIDGFKLSISQMIPCAEVIAAVEPFDDAGLPGLRETQTRKENGLIRVDDSLFFIWFVDILEQKIFFRIQRKKIPFSSQEQRMIETIPSLLRNLNDIHSREFLGFSLKFSSRISFGDLLIAKFLEKDPSRSLWSTISITASLQDLTFRRYENQKCTSGFVYTDQPAAFKEQIRQSSFNFYEFEEKTKLNYSFFDTPASYRYVDGRNSFFLIDDEQNVLGVLRLASPGTFSLIDRIGNRHLTDILGSMPGTSWISFVGLKDEVFVIPGKGCQLKWSKNHWFLRDRTLIFDLLRQFGFEQRLTDLFVSIVFSLSEQRFGSVILIPDDETRLPPPSGKLMIHRLEACCASPSNPPELKTSKPRTPF